MPRMKRRLRDMVVLITGASAGIGRALAIELAGCGAKLALAARRIERLEELRRSLPGEHLCLRADVSIPADCQAIVAQTLQHFGRLDTLVCNAGYGLLVPVAEMPSDEMQRMFATNVFGTTECIRAAVPLMKQQEPRDGRRGQVVIVSSAAARRGLPFFGAYAATKAAQLSLAEALRVELKHDRIAVSSVHPIGTDTDFFTTAEKASGRHLPPRSAVEIHQSAEEVARAIVRGIERPRPEIWPFWPARLALSLATLFPWLVDRVMGKHRRIIEDRNEGMTGSSPESR